MNRRELLKAIPGIPGMYVNGRLASKVADALPAKGALTRGPREPGKVIANNLVLSRTQLLEVLTGPEWEKDVWAAKKKARDFIYLSVLPILDTKCPNCHKLWEYHSEAKLRACFNALREVPVTPPRVAIR